MLDDKENVVGTTTADTLLDEPIQEDNVENTAETTKEQDTDVVDNTTHKKNPLKEEFFNSLSFNLLIIGVLSFISRMLYITRSDKGTPVFDEKHYVSQAAEMLNNGGIEYNPNYGLVVHPPMGKWLISLGEIIFGYTPLGWRFTSILAGVATTILLSFVVYRLTRSYTYMYITAAAITMEGLVFGMSRFGMLDSFLVLCVVILLALAVEYVIDPDRDAKPFMARWYLFAAGIVGGIMMSIKVSGVYYMAFFGIAFVIFTPIMSKKIVDAFKALGSGLIYFFVIPTTVFFMTYIPWFSNESSVYRHAVESMNVESNVPTYLTWLPNFAQNFLHYYIGVMKFHTGLHTSTESFHPYESKPWEWLIGARPMLFLTQNDVSAFIPGENILGRTFLVANPAMWYMTIPVILYCIVMFSWKKKSEYFFVLAGYITGWVPWAIIPERQMYLFYAAVLSPFLVLGLILILRDTVDLIVERKQAKGKEVSRDKIIPLVAAVVLVPAIACSVAMIPWVFGLGMPSKITDEVLSTMLYWSPVTKDNVEQVIAFP